MACFHPVTLKRNRNGEQLVPCGGCLGCRLEYSRQWAVRCMHEASLYDDNCMVTLTYDDLHLPEAGCLDRSAFPLFMKRLRKAIEPQKVRYFHAGEYGERFGRPHYHALLFGYDFPDKVKLGNRGDFPVWRSPSLEVLWSFGRSEIGSVTFESAAYVARYVVKKCSGAHLAPHVEINLESGELIEKVPEYCTMSRRPGVGARWFERFGAEVMRSDEVLCRGKLMKPPRFYDGRFEIADPMLFGDVKARRLMRHRVGNREAAEANAKARYSLYKRGLE